MQVRIEGCVALVTGANRGLGAAFGRLLLERGAKKVYAGARDPGAVAAREGFEAVRLDITDPGQVSEAAWRCTDLTLVVNNAGVLAESPLLAAPSMKGARDEMEVNYFGTLAMCRAFAPILARNGGGGIVNVLSIASFYANPAMGSYAASKAAAWALTNAVRVELRRQGTQVVAVHSGYVDTDMTVNVTAPKASPETVVNAVLDALEAGAEEVLADERTRQVKASLPTDLESIYPEVQRSWDQRPE
jgi:NAD(P)-dependent dehydrogenase (short-subunit alcohol dehydrogenase family)